MAYDAMRGLLQTALMKRALLDMYVAVGTAQHADRRNLASNIQFQQIQQDVAHAYAVVASLYANIHAWRMQHADRLIVPPASAVTLTQMEGFIARIAAAVDDDADMLVDFPGQGKTGCVWTHLGARTGFDAIDQSAELPADLGMDSGDADDVAAEIDALLADLEDDADYLYEPDRATPMTIHDATECTLGWQLESTYDRQPERDDFACQDMTWPPRDVEGPHLTDAEYRHLFGLTPILAGPYDIFGNSIDLPDAQRDRTAAPPPPDTDDDDSPDYNVPGQ